MTTIVLTAAMLLACVPVSAGLTLDNGAIHNLNYAVTEDDVFCPELNDGQSSDRR